MAKEKKEESKERVETPETSEAKPAKTKAAKAEAKAPKASKKEASSESKTPGSKSKGPAVKRAPLVGKTYFAKEEDCKPGWRIVDATNVPLGRMSALVAHILMGKDKPLYTRSANIADHVIVVNAEKVLLTGNKWNAKTYNYHTQFPGGIKTFTARELLEKHPKRLVEWSVYGMLPKGHMGRKWYKKLWVYTGAEHPHQAQKPQPVKLPNLGFEGRN